MKMLVFNISNTNLNIKKYTNLDHPRPWLNGRKSSRTLYLLVFYTRSKQVEDIDGLTCKLHFFCS